MNWSRFWVEQSQRAADRRRHAYGFDPPPKLAEKLQDVHARIGFVASLQLILYVLVGSPRQMLDVGWRYFTDRDTPRRRIRIEAYAKELHGMLSGECRVMVEYFERRLYSRDVARVPQFMERLLHRTTPFLAVQTRTEHDVQQVMRFALRHSIPVYPRGVSSSAFGGSVPTMNGIALDLSRMNDVLEIDAKHLQVRVQTGVRWADLAEKLRHHGLAPLSTPSSRFSTIGGWAATGGLGINSFGYGHFSEAILSARVVLPSVIVATVRSGDSQLDELIGTEGQFGIFTELTLKVKKLRTLSRPRLLIFPTRQQALGFVDDLVANNLRPSHIAFYDRERMREENAYFCDRMNNADTVVSENDSVLIHVDDPKEESPLLEYLSSRNDLEIAEAAAAYYMWSERFFPLKFQRLGPCLLAAEIVLSHKAVSEFVKRGQRLAKWFGSTLAVEAFFSAPNSESAHIHGDCVVIASFRCDQTRTLDYLLRLLLVHLLIHLGVSMGGSPYGFGIWNSPFLRRGISHALRKRLRKRKLECDPKLLLNPMKFFGLRTRLANIPGLLFLAPVYRVALGLMRTLSPVIGLAARLLGTRPSDKWDVPDFSGEQKDQEAMRLLGETAIRCTFCGACVASCPAYILTGDERVTGRAKLRLGESLWASEHVSYETAARSFQCLHCGLCEEVCQSRLPLVDCYHALEQKIEREYNRPVQMIEDFVSLADSNRQWLMQTFGVEAVGFSAPGVVHPHGPSSSGRALRGLHD